MTHDDELVKVQVIKEYYDEMCEAVSDFRDNNVALSTENEYMKDFIHWMHLEEGYSNFRENATRVYESEDDPFGRYSL